MPNKQLSLLRSKTNLDATKVGCLIFNNLNKFIHRGPNQLIRATVMVTIVFFVYLTKLAFLIELNYFFNTILLEIFITLF